MKPIFFGLIIAVLLFSSCSKDNSNPTPPPPPDNYVNTAAGSTWNYKIVDNTPGTATQDYTVTSTSRDSTINTKSYHVYTSTAGRNEYRFLSGQDYFEFDSLPANLGVAIERLYLKAGTPMGTTWEQTFSVPVPGTPLSIPVKVSNEIKDIGMSRTVGSTNYSDVIHVSTSLSSASIPSGLTSSIDSYYAPKYGLIENTSVIHLNYAGIVQDVDTHLTLTSATLK